MRLWQKSMIFLARNESVKNFMQSRAMMSKLSMKFVGGKNVSSAVATAKILKSKGLTSSLFYLGEYVEDLSIIMQTVTELKSIASQLAESKLNVHISVDPTQIGYQIDADICNKNAFDLAHKIKMLTNGSGQSINNFLMLDMEDSSVTSATSDIYNTLKSASLPVAITLQAYLYRTEKDLTNIIQNGGAVRLVKGAFAEGKNIAFPNRAEIDANYIKLADLMLSKEAHNNGFYPIFGTHDDRIINKIIEIAHSRKWNKKEYEFEMLYGVRPSYKEKLVRNGEQLRLYLPFGTDWWPYAIRRVGESPKNAKFVIKSLFSIEHIT